jgi:hypothetical protein
LLPLIEDREGIPVIFHFEGKLRQTIILRVVGDAQLIDLLEHRADVLVVVDHRIVVGALPASRLTDAFRLRMRPEVHVREVYPQEDRLAGFVLLLQEIARAGRDVVDVVVVRPFLVACRADR